MPSSTTVRAERLSSTLLKVFQGWRDLCLNSQDSSDRQALRTESKTLFSSLFQTTEVAASENLVLKTKASHSDALAHLVQELGPAFSEAPLSSIICAICCLDGAIEASSGDGLSFKIFQLLGTFLLGHCGPIEYDEGDDSDELARDSAVTCLASLVRSKVLVDDGVSIDEVIMKRIELTRKGVERRCSAPDADEMDYDHGYDFPSHRTDIRGGLSTLPRSRRSLCFSLVQACLDGIATNASGVGNDTPTVDESMAAIVSFSEFAPNCLHGESDPRCLLQLLRMLHSLQRNLLPFYQANKNNTTVMFPLLSLFDAVAPYYPVQFEPPPNDVHGITRDGLRSALMDVLCFTSYDSLAIGPDTMLNLSSGIFIERLLPLDNEDGSPPSTLEDKIEAIRDLKSMLFPTTEKLSCCMLSDNVTGELSNALIAAHAEGAAGVSTGGDEGARHKALADACRTLVSNLAVAFESCGRQSLWEVFVKRTVHSLSPLLSTSPESIQGRTATAYLACLAASGGTRTLRVCLETCLPALIELISAESDDRERMIAAIYAIGALFSSFLAALDGDRKDTVVLDPHPLKPFSPSVVVVLCELAAPAAESADAKHIQLRAAAIRAIEPLLSTTPSALLNTTNIAAITNLLQMLASIVSTSSDAMDGTVNSADDDLQMASSRTLGSILGQSLRGTNEQTITSCVIVENESIRQFLHDTVLVNLLASSRSGDSAATSSSRRFDWLALASACEVSQGASAAIIGSLANSLFSAIENETGGTSSPGVSHARECAKVLGFILDRGGRCASETFQSLSMPNISPMGIMSALLPLGNQMYTSTESNGGSVRISMSNLNLPATSDELTEIRLRANWASEIISLLLPAYQYPLTTPQIQELLNYVDHVLPPLSDWQNGQLRVALPLFSSALRQGTAVSERLEPGFDLLGNGLVAMAPSLAEYSLTGDDARARSEAASCLFSIILRFQENRDGVSAIEESALRDTISPFAMAALKGIQSLQAEGLAAFRDSLNLAAVVGTAAACRGGSASKTADQIARFLVQLACKGRSSMSLTKEQNAVDLAVPTSSIEIQTKLEVVAATAFGSMIETEEGTPFWRQRLLHLASSELVSCSDELESGVEHMAGRLLIACHVVASSQIRMMSESTLRAVSEIVVRGFVMCYSESSVNTFCLSDSKELLVATVVKLMAVTPETISKYIPSIILCFLQVCVGSSSDDTRNLPLELLALQGLLVASNSPEEFRKTLLSLKPNVISVVSSANDHPSPVVRRVAVDIVNAWSVLA